MSEASTASRKDLDSVIHTLVVAMNNERSNTPGPRISRGDIAALRRASPSDPGAPTFWRVCTQYVEPHLYTNAHWSNDLESRWITILAMLAELHPLHRRGASAGGAMHNAGVGEQRLFKALRSSGKELLATTRALTRLVANRGATSDLAEWARLVLYQNKTSGRNIRRKLARDYYRSEHTSPLEHTGATR